ncbi:transcription termination/antitermination protein NusG [Clostridium bornimense]|uniref:transcription termination/antitermination protein NusG n=1 Tax=Clostridium bornimense TaxID=1216932 RepID=UPI001C11A3AE|nr:transcription termination/antitermination protein NusG [Clostridium bornimense]MBU5317844.1 transcription termination/antitermination protein NusG [Clostridium bornimense]
MSDKLRWYVVHTYSGYENKVKANLEKTIENRNLRELIPDIIVPEEEEAEEKNGETKITKKKVFPGYVIVHMMMNDETWYIVRNTRGVTGFVGPDPKIPVPLTDEEVEAMGINLNTIAIDLEVGETVSITNGAFEGMSAVIEEINHDKGKVKALVNMFSREIPAELEFKQIEKID